MIEFHTMKAIIHYYEIQTDKAEDIKAGKCKSILVPGYCTFPLYSINEEIIEIHNPDNRFITYAAVNNIKIMSKYELSDNDAEIYGYVNKEKMLEKLKDDSAVTIIEITNVAEGCNCGGKCSCDD